jgi:hypothetical protein
MAFQFLDNDPQDMCLVFQDNSQDDFNASNVLVNDFRPEGTPQHLTNRDPVCGWFFSSDNGSQAYHRPKSGFDER